MDRRKKLMAVKEVKNGYVIDFTLNGVRYRESIPAPINKSAQKRIEEQEAVYKMAISLNDKAIAERFPNSKIIQKAFGRDSDNLTIEQYSSIWFGRYQGDWAPSTIRGYIQKYNSHIKENFGSLSLQDFTPSIYHDWAKKQTLAGKTINDIRSILYQIFKEAFLDDVIDVNPIEKTRRSKVIQNEPEPFNENEMNKILSALDEPYRQYFQLAFFTGMRTGELLALRWEDVDFKTKKIHIRKSISHGIEKEPKTKSSIRNMDMHDSAYEALQILRDRHFKDKYRVFIDPKTGVAYKNAEGINKYIWKKAIKESDVKKRSPYTTRHTYASMMLSQGKNPMWVASQMGHSDWGMIRKIYGRWIPNQV
jgi:integrase